MDLILEELVRKLGIKPGQKSYAIHAPNKYTSTIGVPDSLESIKLLNEKADWIQAFYISKDALSKEINDLKDGITPEGQLWISWPKKSSVIKSDLSDTVVREIGLAAGLVDVKVIAIDETWSCLKFVYRLKDR